MAGPVRICRVAGIFGANILISGVERVVENAFRSEVMQKTLSILKHELTLIRKEAMLILIYFLVVVEKFMGK